MDCFHRKLVYSLLTDGDKIIAKIHGTRDYKVSLWVADGQIGGECSCPMGDMGVFCKHMVAVGLTYLDGDAPAISDGGETKSVKGSKRRWKPKITLDDVRNYLLGKELGDLVEIIMQQVAEDDRLRESLLMQVACRCPDGLDVATFRAAIDAATDSGPDGFIHYRDAYRFTAGINHVVDSIAELLDAGHAAEVIELTEYALESCEYALGHMDDSGGGMTSLLGRLQDVHHAACLKARPDCETLARYLFKWEIEGIWETFLGASEIYADVLGQAGLAVYRQLAQQLWDQTPQLDAGDKDDHDSSRFRITSIMESLARTSGDIEEFVAVQARDLSHPYDYLQIAKTYRDARLIDKALAWAEDGLKVFAGERPDTRMEDFLADEYHRLQRHDDAMALIWDQFTRRMDCNSYQHLQKHATIAKQWPEWRKKALAAVRTALDKQKCKESPQPTDRWSSWRRPVDNSVLVEIFLLESDVDTAWREAQAGGCSNSLWMMLAKVRQEEHPADSIDIYKKQIAPIVDQKNKSAYRDATKLIGKIRKLMNRLDRSDEFLQYLALVRKTHKRKRNFISMLSDL